MKWASLAPVQQTTLADIVTNQIRDGIIAGQLRPGEKLAEPELATFFQVSRSPVREALRRLEQEGLVVREPNRSCYVWQPTIEDVEEIHTLRTMVECLAAELVIDQLNEDDFTHLYDALQRQRQLVAETKYIELLHEDMRFHEYICQRANHNRLLDWWGNLMSQWKVILYQRMTHNPQEVVPSVLVDHQSLLEAFHNRDLPEVVRLHRSINRRVSAQSKEALTLIANGTHHGVTI
ncbi:MAG: GntR family transcriptional regulator [Caldilineaceae bacterium]|nr:GntR family transcriptional regulator [Caldilineaceae bacterium]